MQPFRRAAHVTLVGVSAAAIAITGLVAGTTGVTGTVARAAAPAMLRNTPIREVIIDQLPFGAPGKPVEFDPTVTTYEATAFALTDHVTVWAKVADGVTYTVNGKTPGADGRVGVDLNAGDTTITVTAPDAKTYTLTVHKVNTDFRGNVVKPITVAVNGGTADDAAKLVGDDANNRWQAPSITSSKDWSTTATGFQIDLGDSPMWVNKITANQITDVPAGSPIWAHGGLLSIAYTADGQTWHTIADKVGLRSPGDDFLYIDLGASYQAKALRLWLNGQSTNEVQKAHATSSLQMNDLKVWGPIGTPAENLQATATPTDKADTTSQMSDYNKLAAEWGVDRAQAIAIDRGIMIPSWVPSEGFGRGVMNAQEQKLAGGNVLPVFYDPPLFNESAIRSMPGTGWGLAKAPTGANSMHEGEAPSKFLTDEMLPYAKDLVDIQYGDEGGYSEGQVQTFKDWFAFSKQQYPGAIVHSNQFNDGTWAANMEHYTKTAKPDLLSWDTYYFQSPDGAPRTPAATLPSLLGTTMWHAQRKAALEGLTGDGSQPILWGQYLDYAAMQNISESQKAITPWLSMAMGAKWFGGFRMEQNGFDVGGLFDHSGAPTRNFYEYSHVFDRVVNIGHTLGALNNQYTAFVPGDYGSAGARTIASGWHMGNFDTKGAWRNNVKYGIYNVSVANRGTLNEGRPGDVVLGYFDKVPGLTDAKTSEIFGDGVTDPRAIMVVNGMVGTTDLPVTNLDNRTDDGSSWETTQDVTLTLAAPTASAKLMQVDSTTGNIAPVETQPFVGQSPESEGPKVTTTLQLAGGEGALLFWTSDNPTIGTAGPVNPIDKVGTAYYPSTMWADSEELIGEEAPNGLIGALVDQTDSDEPDYDTFWHSQWFGFNETPPGFPHALFMPTANNGLPTQVCAVVYSARQGNGSVDGPKNATVFGFDKSIDKTVLPQVSDKTWADGTKVADIVFGESDRDQIITIKTDKPYIGIALWDNYSGKKFTSASDLRLVQCKTDSTSPSATPSESDTPPISLPDEPSQTPEPSMTLPDMSETSTPSETVQPSQTPTAPITPTATTTQSSSVDPTGGLVPPTSIEPSVSASSTRTSEPALPPHTSQTSKPPRKPEPPQTSQSSERPQTPSTLPNTGSMAAGYSGLALLVAVGGASAVYMSRRRKQ